MMTALLLACLLQAELASHLSQKAGCPEQPAGMMRIAVCILAKTLSGFLAEVSQVRNLPTAGREGWPPTNKNVRQQRSKQTMSPGQIGSARWCSEGREYHLGL